MTNSEIFSTRADAPVFLSRSGMATVAKLASQAIQEKRYCAIVVRNRDELALMRGLLTLFLPDLSVGREKNTPPPDFYKQPFVTLPPFNRRSLNREGWADRLAALYALGQGYCRCVILTADNLIPRLPALNFFQKREFFVRTHEDMAPELLTDQLTDWGYLRESMVSHAGDMARRGDILDIVPPGYEKPVRLDFFGNTIDEMRFFDPSTQRSVGQSQEICLLPVTPVPLERDEQTRIRKRLTRLFQLGRMTEFGQASILRAMEQGDTRLMPGVVCDNATTLENWLPAETIWFLPGASDTKEMLTDADRNWREALKEDKEETTLDQPDFLALRNADDALASLSEKPRVYAEPLLMGVESTGFDLPERTYRFFTDLFPGEADQDRPWQQLAAGLKSWTASRRQVLLAFQSERGRQKFLKLAEQDGILPNLRYDPRGRGLFALVAPVHYGAELVWDNSLVLGEDLLQPRAESGKRVSTGAFRGLDSYEDLAPGDLLVHRDYGIGRFGGLHRMTLGGVDNDYLLLEYADNAKLYLPVDRLAVIQRFKAGDGPFPVLDKLGGTAWVSSKEKARKAVEKIAADLVEMYAWRKVAKGFSYSPIGEMYREFEASFGFEETPDQARAIQEVLDDMEKPVPMDRLVCGDVGFGKTEVALRAAFRAACDGRQVALLCPTTVLAEQHYQTFRSRLGGFPINVGLLSRFVSRSQQQETLKAAEKGQIDILIGTHRILSADVHLPNLGLLILDEEQRFGVRHKEKLKALKKNVDALTLTATPIPRTLQLSMSGIRELSVIKTAPPERKPVATAILNRDKNALRQILERELERKGQVFWVYNRVNGLEKVAAFVRELVPQARVGMAHGQMGEKELEGTMHKFWHGELDVLVCTSIVESGLDFPMANTLIVDQAQMFGLGQLYQLRGRVGRSDRQAYAIFVVSDMDALPKLAQERLRIILEMDYLGAGFQVAMEDLRLRGAGNILGEAQSGHMARVGLDLYLEMLEEAVSRLRGDGELLRSETEINLALPAHIPENYIEDGRERLKYYKMLSTAVDAQARQNVELELRDRFGAVPPELETFLEVLNLKEQVNKLGIIRADIHSDRIRVTFADGQKKVQPENLIRFITSHPDSAKLYPPASLEIRLSSKLPVPGRLLEAKRTLMALAG